MRCGLQHIPDTVGRKLNPSLLCAVYFHSQPPPIIPQLSANPAGRESQPSIRIAACNLLFSWRSRIVKIWQLVAIDCRIKSYSDRSIVLWDRASHLVLTVMVRESLFR